MEEAIAHINASRFGKAASVYTQCGRNARACGGKVQAGNIGIARATGNFSFVGQKDEFFGTMQGLGSEDRR